MAKYVGKDGVVKIDATGGTVAALLNVIAFSFTESVGSVRTDGMGDEWEDKVATKKSFAGSITVHKDPGDAGQQKLRAGAIIDFEVYPEGETTGMESLTGTALVTSRGENVTMDEVIGLEVSIEGKGALTLAAVV